MSRETSFFAGNIGQDLRLALRAFRKNPSFTAAVLLTITLGIGVGTAVFSIVNAVLIQPLPYEEPDRLVMLRNIDGTGRSSRTGMSAPEFEDWTEQSDVFEHIVRFWSGAWATRRGDESWMMPTTLTTGPGLFPLLGVEPLLGRSFLPEDHQPGAEQVMILQYDFWKRLFPGETDIAGQELVIWKTPHTIIGVMKPGFVLHARDIDYLLPYRFDPGKSRNWDRRRRLQCCVMGRLKPGVSLEQAQAQADVISQRLAQEYPDTNRNWNVQIVPVTEETAGEIRPAMILLLGAVGFVLLIVCSNVANLLMVRASAREREMALRSAMGASRQRLLRQFLTESVILSLAGGLLGLALAYGIVGYFQTQLPDRGSWGRYILQADAVRVDSWVVAFGTGATLVTGILFSLIPALRASKPNMNGVLNDSGKGSLGGRRSRRLRDMLVITEVALAVVLVVGAALLARSFAGLYERGPGFRPDRALVLMPWMSPDYVVLHTNSRDLSSDGFWKDWTEQLSSFRTEFCRRVSAFPGVVGVTMGTTQVMSARFSLRPFTIKGADGNKAVPEALQAIVDRNYFEVLGIPLLRGRRFGPQDRKDTRPVVIVSQEVARRSWPGEDALGKHLKRGLPESDSPWAIVVGVVGDIRQNGLDEAPTPILYWSGAEVGSGPGMTIRTTGDPMALVPAIRKTFYEMDPKGALTWVRRLDDVVRDSVWQLNYSMILMGSLAALSLLLAMAGVYGLLSYSVRMQTREIGVRMALGAERRQVLAAVIKQGLARVAVGVAVGLLIAAGLTRFLGSLLFGVQPMDLLTFAGVALALMTAACLASYIPARRATKVDPMVALRHE